MDSTFKTYFFHLFALYLLGCVACVEYVPVFMWETAKHTETVPALDRISEESFKDLLLERLAKNPFIVVFTERNLSPEDFAQRDVLGNTPYLNLVDLKSKAKVTYWPFVHNPTRALKQLDKKLVVVSADSLLGNLEVPKDSILVVDLNDARDDEDRTEMLKRHDALIADVYNKILGKYENVLALYTSHHTSWVIPEDVRSSRHARSLLATKDDSEDTRVVFNSTYVLFYLNSTGIYQNNTVLANLSSYTNSSTYDASTGTVTLTLSSTNNPTIAFQFVFSQGYWNISSIKVTESGREYDLAVRDIYAPTGFSYHCTSQVFYGDSLSQNLTLPGFQVQPYAQQQNGSFGDAYDCVGFTTAPIWSGLFVTFILALIMTFGLSMMMDIKTMDRFDDPKGKTITVNVSE